MKNTIKLTEEKNSFIVEAEGKKLRVSYAEFEGNHEDAMKFCNEHGGGDETVKNLQFIAKYRDVINEELKKFGKTEISDWYWSNEISLGYISKAWLVYMRSGYVLPYNYNKNNPVRAIHEL